MPADAPTAAGEFPFVLAIPTRWKDNDVYGHVNNVEYYSFFDTAINTWLIERGGLDIRSGDVIGVCAESHCRFERATSFPTTVSCGVRVESLGTTSVRYELGLFDADGERLATGWFVHVFVGRDDRRPAPMPERIRAALERLRRDDPDPGSEAA